MTPVIIFDFIHGRVVQPALDPEGARRLQEIADRHRQQTVALAGGTPAENPTA